MFSKSKNRASVLSVSRKFDLTKDVVQVEDDMPSVLCRSVVVSGDIEKKGDMHIEGYVKGNVCARALTLGPDSHIKGDVRAMHVRCSGRIEGDVSAKVVEVFSTAVIKGNIEHETLAIESGAQLEGLCHRSTPEREEKRGSSAFGTSSVIGDTKGGGSVEQAGQVFGAEPQEAEEKRIF